MLYSPQVAVCSEINAGAYKYALQNVERVSVKPAGLWNNS